MKLDALPERLLYLRPYLEYLESLEPEEIHEDTETEILELALRERSEQFDDRWEAEKEIDLREFNAWLEEDEVENADGYFVLPFLEEFTRGQELSSEILEASRQTPSGLTVSPMECIKSINDELHSLSIELNGGLVLSITPMKYLEFQVMKASLKFSANSEITQVILGPWKGTKVSCTTTTPIFTKQVQYALKFKKVQFLAGAIDPGFKDFDEEIVEAVLAKVKSV